MKVRATDTHFVFIFFSVDLFQMLDFLFPILFILKFARLSKIFISDYGLQHFLVRQVRLDWVNF